MKKSIFISYRREPALPVARNLRTCLARRANVFMDKYDISGGAPVRETIRNAVSKVDIMIVLVSDHWADRLSEPTDYVRWEIELAIEHQVRIFVVTYNDAKLPKRDALPEGIRTISGINWIPLREASFENDCRDLVNQVLPRKTWPLVAGPSALGIAGVALLKFLWPQPGPPDPPHPPPCHVSESSYDTPVDSAQWCQGTTGEVACEAPMPDHGKILGTCRGGVPDGLWSSLAPNNTARWTGKFVNGAQDGTWTMPSQYRNRSYASEVTFKAGTRQETHLTVGSADVTLRPVKGLSDAESIRCGSRTAVLEPLGDGKVKLVAANTTQKFEGAVDGEKKPLGTWTVTAGDTTTTVSVDSMRAEDRAAWAGLAHSVLAYVDRVGDCASAVDEHLPEPSCGAHSDWKPKLGCVPRERPREWAGDCSRKAQGDYRQGAIAGCHVQTHPVQQQDIQKGVEKAYPDVNITCQTYYDCVSP